MSLVYVFLDIDKYPKLNECFKTSVSKKNLCSSSNNYVQLKNVSDDFKDVVITSEDDKFYFHQGFDWSELQKSMIANFRALSFVRGGSTITQQLVKNVYLSQEKSLLRKIKEAVLAYQIEKKYSKNLILEKYVNAIEFGENIWGIKDASEHYFNKSPKELDLLESAYLVVLLPNPKVYSNSFREKELTSYQSKRIKTLLKRIKFKRKIPDEEFDKIIEKIPDFPWDQPSILDFEIDLYDFY